jgi:purine-binding chemotaxis protein CheW
MNLAKIRQKALKGQSPAVAEPATVCLREAMPAVTQSGEEQLLSSVGEEFCPPNIREAAEAAPVYQNPSPHRYRDVDPLEKILAGRVAAGCDEDSPFAVEDEPGQDGEDYEEILCFRVSGEIYGINIMEIKEIIKPRETTEVPRTPSFIMGVISLRGVIIPVLNMRERLGLSQEARGERERVVVVKLNEGFSGLLVDEIIQVVRIRKDEFEPTPSVLEGIDRDFVVGIGHSGTMMVILLNVTQIADINLY